MTPPSSSALPLAEPTTPPSSSALPLAPEIENLVHPALKHRKIAAENIMKQSIRMKKRAEKILSPAAVGDCVAVFISEFDRGKADPPNVLGVVIEVHENGRFTVGTKVGIFRNQMERTCFEVTKYKGLKTEDVPNVILTSREIVRLQSVGNGQGYKRCSCKGSCADRRCQCFKNDLKCNSACHKHNNRCKNHD